MFQLLISVALASSVFSFSTDVRYFHRPVSFSAPAGYAGDFNPLFPTFYPVKFFYPLQSCVHANLDACESTLRCPGMAVEKIVHNWIGIATSRVCVPVLSYMKDHERREVAGADPHVSGPASSLRAQFDVISVDGATIRRGEVTCSMSDVIVVTFSRESPVSFEANDTVLLTTQFCVEHHYLTPAPYATGVKDGDKLCHDLYDECAAVKVRAADIFALLCESSHWQIAVPPAPAVTVGRHNETHLLRVSRQSRTFVPSSPSRTVVCVSDPEPADTTWLQDLLSPLVMIVTDWLRAWWSFLFDILMSASDDFSELAEFLVSLIVKLVEKLAAIFWRLLRKLEPAFKHVPVLEVAVGYTLLYWKIRDHFLTAAAVGAVLAWIFAPWVFGQ